MPFKKGKPKTGGRQKGTPNKRRTIFESLERITSEGKPVDLIELFFKGLITMPPYQQVDAILDLMKFVYPQQKALEIGNKQGEDGQEGFKILIEDYSKK